MRTWAWVTLTLLLAIGIGFGVLVSRELDDIDQRVLRIETVIEGRPGPRGAPGETRVILRRGRLIVQTKPGLLGPRGDPGRSVTFAQIVAALNSFCARHNQCRGPAGAPGLPGPAGPAGAPGEPGKPGTDRTVTVEITRTVIIERPGPATPGTTVTTPGTTVTVPPPPTPPRPCPPRNPRCP